MPITEERFDHAEEVIESGVVAAAGCLQAGKRAVETVELLTEGLRENPPSPEALLELLAVALMIIVKERAQAKEETHG